jgi:hypothetical protein
MLDREYTVYFDTQFYVQLCRADEAEADQIIRDLNTLNVRHVISNILIRELITSRNRTNLDEVLVQRVRQLKVPPYRAEPYLEWEVLLLSGQHRIDAADTFRELDDQITVATSNSIMARRKTNPEQQAELLKANRSVLDQFGFPEDFQKDQAQVVSAAKGILDMLGLADRIQWPEDVTATALSNLSEQIKGILDPSDIAFVEEHDRIQDSTTLMEDRPYQVAIGAAPPASTKRLSNTLRDTEHMMFFVLHQNEIDLLQVDKAQHALINRSSPKHRLAELGLAHRCFAADTPLTATTKVRDLMASRRREA